jgi:hypothetical protein|tara:strand:+ start:290 stop:460 length:171 start_codon:yes stop_codon:yes gene_type:complete
MEEQFRMWLTKMYFENCKEREINRDKPFRSIDAYYREHHDWLDQKFNKEIGVEYER